MTPEQLHIARIIYIAVVAFIGLMIIFLIAFFPIRKSIIRKKYIEHYYREIHRIVLNHDYYLINNFSFKVDENKYLSIEHILFADKYIYIINDFHFDGDILGKGNDKSLVLINKTGKKKYIDNPILKNKNILQKLAMATTLDPALMIGVSLVNDDCKCEIFSDSKQFYLISRNKLGALIKAIESRQISNINAKSLEKLVQSFNRIKQKNAKKK